MTKAEQKLAELRNKFGSVIEVCRYDEADKIVEECVGKLEKDKVASADKLYDIYRNENGDCVFYKTGRWEIHLVGGQSCVIWICESAVRQAAAHSVGELESLKRIALNYDSDNIELYERAIKVKHAELNDMPVGAGYLYGFKALKRGAITGAEFVYLNAPFEIRYLLKSTVDREIEDETSVFGWLLECFLKSSHSGVTKGRDVLILEKLTEDKAEIVKLVEIAAKYNRDVQGYFADIKNTRIFKVNISEVLYLQKNFKKFLKLGQLDLAEIAFNNLKQIFRQAA